MASLSACWRAHGGRNCWRAPAGTFRRARARAKRDGASLVVGGLSLGAVLSLILAAEQPDDVAGVMALSPTLFYDGWNVPWTHRLIPLADYLPVKHFLYLREQSPYGIKDEILRKKIAAAYERAELGETAQTQRSWATRISRCDCSARCGTSSRFAGAVCRACARRCCCCKPKKTTRRARAMHTISSNTSARPSTELVMLANSYHVITADLDRVEVAASMTRFCLSLLGTPLEYDVQGEARA